MSLVEKATKNGMKDHEGSSTVEEGDVADAKTGNEFVEVKSSTNKRTRAGRQKKTTRIGLPSAVTKKNMPSSRPTLRNCTVGYRGEKP